MDFMWKFIEDLKNDFKQGVDDLGDQQITEAQVSEMEQEALNLGKETIRDDEVVAIENGTVEMINENQDQVEIYMDNGHGYGIQFPFGPTEYQVMVSPNEKVKKGDILVKFGPDMQNKARIYAFTPDMVRLLSHSRLTLQ